MPQSPRRYKPPLDRIGDRHIQLFLRHVSGRDIEQRSLYGCDLVAITILNVPGREGCPMDDDGGVLGAEARRHRHISHDRRDLSQQQDAGVKAGGTGEAQFVFTGMRGLAGAYRGF
jgi:hypothetical protein